jgi:hypothetical protein
MDFCINAPPGQGVSEPIPAGAVGNILAGDRFIRRPDGFGGPGVFRQAALGHMHDYPAPASSPTVLQVTPTAPGKFQLDVTSTAPGGAAVSATGSRKSPVSPRSASFLTLLTAIWIALLAISGARVMKTGMNLPRLHRDIAKFVQGGALLLALAIALAACGGGTATSVPAPGTPSGTYTVTVTATVRVVGQTTVTRTIPITVTIE